MLRRRISLLTLTQGSQSWPWPTFMRIGDRGRLEFRVPRSTRGMSSATRVWVACGESERQTSGAGWVGWRWSGLTKVGHGQLSCESGTAPIRIRRLDDCTEAHPRRVVGAAYAQHREWLGAASVRRPDGRDEQKLAMANFCVNRAVPPRACRLNKARVPWLRPLASVASLLSRRSGTRPRTWEGWTGSLAVASGPRKLAMANCHENALRHLDSSHSSILRCGIPDGACTGGYELDRDGRAGPLRCGW
jgi:hypothetical protein